MRFAVVAVAGVGGATTFSRNNATHRSPMHAHESPRSRVDSRATSGGEVEFAAGAQPQLGVGEEAKLGRGRSGSGAGDAAFEDGQAAALRTIMAHPDVEAFLYELEISDDEIEDEAAAQPTFAMKLPEKPDRRRRKSVYVLAVCLLVRVGCPPDCVRPLVLGGGECGSPGIAWRRAMRSS